MFTPYYLQKMVDCPVTGPQPSPRCKQFQTNVCHVNSQPVKGKVCEAKTIWSYEESTFWA